MKKKIIIVIILALLLAIAGIVVYVLTNLDSIVKTAIEKSGSDATKTAVRVSSVEIKLAGGEGAVRGLTVANPPGFASPSIFTLNDIAVRIDVKTVTGTPVVIDNILISGPEVFYEMKENGTSNMDILKENLAKTGTSRQETPNKSQKANNFRLRIRKLVIENGKVHVRIAKLMDKPYTVDLPRLELTDIGKHDGAAPAEIAHTIATALAEQTAQAVAREQGDRLIRKGAEDLINKYLNK